MMTHIVHELPVRQSFYTEVSRDGWACNGVELLPYNALPDITDPSWRPDPLVVHHTHAQTGQQVIAIGVGHFTDPSLPTYKLLHGIGLGLADQAPFEKSQWVLLNEGGTWPFEDDPEVAYRKYGEMGLMTSMAGLAGENLPLFSPEPRNHCADELLALGFGKEELACFYYLRFLGQWHDGRGSLQDALYRKRDSLGWPDADFSIPNLDALCQKICGRAPGENDRRFCLQQSVGYMLEPTSRIQEIAIACNKIRDLLLARTILQHYREGSSIFVVFGWPHIRTLQPFLESLGEDMPQESAERPGIAYTSNHD